MNEIMFKGGKRVGMIIFHCICVLMFKNKDDFRKIEKESF